MRKPAFTVFLAFLLGGFVGCDEKSDPDPDTPSWLSTSSYGDHGAGDDGEYNGLFVSTGGMRDALASGPVPGNEGLAQKWRAKFDGDTRFLGAVAGSPVSAGPNWEWGPRGRVRDTGPRKRRDSGDPPYPFFSNADLPEPGPEDGPKEGGPTLRGFAAFQKKFYKSAMSLFSRLDWKARKRRGRDQKHDPVRVTVHHTVGSQTMKEEDTLQAVRSIQWYHMIGRQREGKQPFDDIGYHFLIDGKGRIIEGRHAEVLGAHAGGGYNARNIGVAVMGDFNKVKPTKEQEESLRRLIAYLAIKYKRDPARRGFLQGHNHFKHTSCPGKNLTSILNRLRMEIDGEADRIVKKIESDKNEVVASGFFPVIATIPTA